jgi:hypothetical protein
MSLTQRVEHFLSEHFKAYVLVAYDYDGSNIVFRCIGNQEELDALSASFTREGDVFEKNLYGKREDEDEDDEY